MELEPDLPQCPICLETIANDQNSNLLKCAHHVCPHCFSNLIKYSHNCPLCGEIFYQCDLVCDSQVLATYKLSEEDLSAVKRHKNSIQEGWYFLIVDESFDCFSKEELKKELRQYKGLANKLNTDLFLLRTGDGSKKELAILSQAQEKILVVEDLLTFSHFNSKEVMKCLGQVVDSIKDLQTRKFVN